MAPVERLSPPAENIVPDAAGRNYLTRSEERLSVATERVPSGWVRLEKFLVTETRTMTVELTHEEVRLVRGAADSDSAPRQFDAVGGQKNHARWMLLSREEAIITKRVVPVDRIRLEVYQVTEERQITEQVKKEHVGINTINQQE